VDARSGTIEDQLPSMLIYQSKVMLGNRDRYWDVLVEAANLARNLWKTDSELLQAFEKEWHKPENSEI
jgi:hypothetical protein